MLYSIIFIPFLIACVSSTTSEDSLVKKIESDGTWARRQPQLIYVFVTNRAESFTHGSGSNEGALPGADDVYLRAVFMPSVDKIARLDVNYSILIFFLIVILTTSFFWKNIIV